MTKTGVLESCLVDLALSPVFDGAFITIILLTIRARRPRDIAPLEHMKAPRRRDSGAQQ
ncbi:hypothetical protein IVB02_00785 [Bradyrhizobium sp. 166]|uniref:hypothetical protein n=1 Tax=Bradyrhizobium sp. 166 TaxID=2782638 RepID=UPI001FFB126A|nr:hypothetical protein [Bradyrhizobium sp. 166]MCK1599990.1 hypothetical protein [Bradyrhizobium sp. 166]